MNANDGSNGQRWSQANANTTAGVSPSTSQPPRAESGPTEVAAAMPTMTAEPPPPGRQQLLAFLRRFQEHADRVRREDSRDSLQQWASSACGGWQRLLNAFENNLDNKWPGGIAGLLNDGVKTWPVFGCPVENLDHVYVCSVAEASGANVSAEVWDKAWTDFCRFWRYYRRLFGEYLPAKFRLAADKWQQSADYDADTKPRALDVWDEHLLRKSIAAQRPRGCATGLPTIDNLIGGLAGLCLLGGPPGVGKSALGLHMARAALAADPKLAVLVYTLDMSNYEWLDRLLSAEAGLPRAALRSYTGPTAGGRAAEADARLRTDVLPRLRVIGRADYGPAGLTHHDMLRHRAELVTAADATACFVLFDYLQKLPLPEGDAAPGTELDADLARLQALGSYVTATRNPAKPEGETLLAITEVRKPDGDRRELRLEDIRGHGRLAFGPGAVMLLQPTDVAESPNQEIARLSLRVAKCRDGRLGSVPLQFHHQIYRFEEAADCPPSTAAPVVPKAPSAAGGAGRRRAPYAGTP